MELKGVKYDFVQSEASGSVERLTKMMCVNGYETIVIVGGDGSLNSAVNAMMQYRDSLPENFAFAIIPNGIANDFSRFWGVSVDDYKQVIDGIIARNIRKVDVGCCIYNEEGAEKRRYFLNVLNIGVSAYFVELANKKRTFFAKAAYRVIGFFHLLFRRQKTGEESSDFR
jgi:diacylglycerol kinase family enzyme